MTGPRTPNRFNLALSFLGVLGASAFIALSSGTSAAEVGALVVEIRRADSGGASLIDVQGRNRSADELQLICKRELESRPDLSVVFRIDGLSAYETFYTALSACYSANVAAVTFESADEKAGPPGSLAFKMPPKPGTDGRASGFRPEVHVRLYREGDRTVAYALGRERLEPGAALKAAVAEGLKRAGDATLVLRAEREVPCRDVLAAYVLCREAGAGQVAFARAW